jgi:hypothetical protein
MATKRAKPARPPQIVPLGEGLDKFIRILVYSRPGQGKTVLAGTGGAKTLILEADRGTESAVVRGSKAQKWELTDWESLYEAISYLRHGGASDFDWVWLDSLTLFQERGMDDIMEELHARKPHREIWAPDKGEYGQNMNRLSRAIRELKDLPINLGITAHEYLWEDENGVVEPMIMPRIQGRGMPEKVCSYMGVVGRMELKASKDGKDYTVLDCRGTERFYGKDRYGTIGRMVRPTIPKIVQAAASASAQGTGGKSTSDTEAEEK